jgi:hypothetical protein
METSEEGFAFELIELIVPQVIQQTQWHSSSLPTAAVAVEIAVGLIE